MEPAYGDRSFAVMESAMNVDQQEVGRFDRLASRFWDARGEFRTLHLLNPVRAGFVADRSSIANARVLDVGCGGGLLCEALARMGGRVVGVDMAPGMIEVARLHATEQRLDIDYRLTSAEELAASGEGDFDIVTCMEMIEHVPEPARTMATL